MSDKEDQEAFEEIGRLIARLFAGAIRHATETAGAEAGAFLAQHFRDGRGVRAVVGLDVGEVTGEPMNGPVPELQAAGADASRLYLGSAPARRSRRKRGARERGNGRGGASSQA